MPADPHIQSRRREAIARILQEGQAPTQQAVVRALRDAGFDATQSSVSRDFQVLGVRKTARGYQLPATVQGEDDALGDAAGYIRTVRGAGPNLVVIRTAIGAAQRVALAVDRADWPEIIGTVSGDDTLFVATASQTHTRNVIRRLEQLSRREVTQ